MRISLIVDPRCGSDSSQAPVQRRLILTPNKYRKSAVRPSAMGELQGANTKSSKNRSNKKETNTHNTEFSFHVIRCHFGSLLFALVFAPPSCIGARTLHLSRHLASVFAPCPLLVCHSADSLCFACLTKCTSVLSSTMQGTPGDNNAKTKKRQ